LHNSCKILPAYARGREHLTIATTFALTSTPSPLRIACPLLRPQLDTLEPAEEIC